MDDNCVCCHPWRNNVVIAFGTLSSFLTKLHIVSGVVESTGRLAWMTILDRRQTTRFMTVPEISRAPYGALAID